MSEIDDILGGADKPSFEILEGKHEVTIKGVRVVNDMPGAFPFTAVDYEGEDGIRRSFKVDRKYPEKYNTVRKQWLAVICSSLRGELVQTKDLGDKENAKLIKGIVAGEPVDAKAFVTGIPKDGKNGKTYVNAYLSLS